MSDEKPTGDEQPNSDGKPWPRIILGIPCERFMYTEAAHAFMSIVSQGIPFIAHGYARTDRARCNMAKQFVGSDFTHLLMLDSDHIHPREIVQQLGRLVVRHPELLVVGGLNYRRGEPYDPCAYIWDEDHNLCPIHNWPEEALLKVDVLGSGSIMIAREVFEQLPFPWFGYDYAHAETLEWPGADVSVLDNMQYPGTDLWFSALCNEHGIDQWVYTGVSSPHIIHSHVTGDVRNAFLRKAEAYGEILTAQKPTQARLSQQEVNECQDEGDSSASSGPGGDQMLSEEPSRASVVYLPTT